MNCRICGVKSHSEYCFRHKPIKPLKFRSLRRKEIVVDTEGRTKMHNFFLSIWKKRKEHKCENCGKWLGNEPHSYMFDHILEKQKYPQLKYEEDDIWYLCLQCHDEKTRGHLSSLMEEKQRELKIKYNL